jgi:negative regulator of sigma E activity
MNSSQLDSQARRQLMSALADGEASPTEAAQAVQAWRDDDESRQAWATYQLIGDALRSDELARDGASDRFLSGLRDRLAQEPVVLAPQSAAQLSSQWTSPVTTDGQAASSGPVGAHPLAVRPARPRTWAGPLAVAAAFVAVLGGVLTLQVPSQGPTSGVTLAQAPGQMPSLATGLSWASTGTPMAQSFVARSQAQGKASSVEEAHTMPVGLVAVGSNSSLSSAASKPATDTELVWLIR